MDESGQEGKPKYIPVESVSNLNCFGNLDANSPLYNFLGKNHINLAYRSEAVKLGDRQEGMDLTNLFT